MSDWPLGKTSTARYQDKLPQEAGRTGLDSGTEMANTNQPLASRRCSSA